MRQNRTVSLEGWPSGLRRTPGKRVGVKAPRGFESPSLRHTPLFFVFVIIVFVDEVNLDINTLTEFAIMSPIGILFLSPIGKFYHHCFINMKDYNKETYELAKDTAVLAKEVMKDSRTKRNRVDKKVTDK